MGFEHELIIPNEGFPFKLFQFEGKDGHYVREKHWHRSIEIFAVFEGTLAFFINEEEYPLGSGEFILLNSNEIHSISSPEANRTIVLQIPMNVLRNVETGGGLILFTHSPKRQDSKIMELIGSMYQELQERGSEYEWKVQSDFFHAGLSAAYEIPKAGDFAGGNPSLPKIKPTFHDHRIYPGELYEGAVSGDGGRQIWLLSVISLADVPEIRTDQL